MKKRKPFNMNLAEWHARGLRAYCDILVKNKVLTLDEYPDRRRKLNEVKPWSAIARVVGQLEILKEQSARAEDDFRYMESV